MSVYRITRFAASDMSAASEHCETMRETLEGVDADFIDIVDYGNGKGVVIAKYPDKAALDATTETAQKVFGQMVEAGLIDADSIHPHIGTVKNSF